MAPSEDLKGLLEDLDLSETYLVCAMFEEAASLASSIVSRLRGSTAPVDGVEAEDIIECAGVVFVQALKGLGRTSEYLKELELLFGSVAAIPIQTFHTGVRFQLQEGHISGLREVMEEFIGKWKLIDGKYYVLADSKLPSSLPEEFMTHYLDLVEVYAVMLRGKLLGDADLAISWVENAELPEEKRQEMLRRLRSLCSLKHSSASSDIAVPRLTETSKRGHAVPNTDSTLSKLGDLPKSVKFEEHSSGDYSRSAFLKQPSLGLLTFCIKPWFSWFHTVYVKFSNKRAVFSHGKFMIWVSSVIFAYYVLRKKRGTLKRIVAEQSSSLKKALSDVWQLAFSVQVNPLAAVQPPTSAARLHM